VDALAWAGVGLFAGAYPVMLYGMWRGALAETPPGHGGGWPRPVLVGMAMWLVSWPVMIAHHALCP
jgi:hypothetical protein